METLFIYGFSLSLVLSLLLIPILIKVSGYLSLIDNPEGNARKLHSTPIARSGGLGIILSVGIALLMILPIDGSLTSFLVSCLVIVTFGLIDDLLELKPVQKLAGQAIGVSLAMAGGMVITDVPFIENCPAWASLGLTFVFVMGVINGVNFSDGMDGLAAGTTLMALVLIFMLSIESGSIQVATIALAISGALVGFLRFNTHPAVIFMGDAGSQFLGFAVAWLAITVSQNDYSPMTSLMPLLILGIPIMDILQVIPVRIKKKLPLAGPDKEHFHHQFAKLGLYQYEVVAFIYILQVFLLVGAYQLRFSPDYTVFSFYVFFITSILSALFIAHLFHWRLRPIDPGLIYERRNPIFRKLGRLHPYSGKLYGALITLFFVSASLASSALSRNLVYVALVWASLLLVVLLFSKNRWPLALGRLSAYSAVAFSVFGVTTSIQGESINTLINGFLIGLAVLVAISIRTTRKDYFWLTPHDLLVLFFIILLAPLMPLDLGQDTNAGELIFRTYILLYTCEYVLARGDQARKRLTTAAIFSLFVLGIYI